MKKTFYCLVLMMLAVRVHAQINSYQLSVAAEATIQEQPPRIVLSWLRDDSAQGYEVYRYDTNQAYWNLMSSVGKNLTWTDTNVAIGVPYEYVIVKQALVNKASVLGYGYVYTGIDLPAQEQSGTVDLIVDDTFATDLSSELTRWENDLTGDGWRVTRHDVKRSASVESVKALIYKDMQQDTSLHTLFLFGHVPVPYSGFLNPDGHPQHYGAWPADVYYGDTVTVWTDTVIDTFSSASQGVGTANINIPGDGKFDQSTTQQVDLQIGRVDFWNMPDFSLSEKQLLKQYLDKDHAFRTGTLTAPKRALVSDNFGTYGEGFACDAWRTYANLVGGKNIHTLDWFSTLDTASYL
ncbi:MAG: fibronectin type III domain-containing protein, partial [Candidatus Kapaibacterium sp.]